MSIPELFYSEYYKRATYKERVRASNGCGTKGWKGVLVPDTVWFLNISAACDIHDIDYTFAKPTIEAKKETDRIFLNNMIRIIDAKTKWKWLKKLRYRRAKTYYAGVKLFGGPAFWQNKN